MESGPRGEVEDESDPVIRSALGSPLSGFRRAQALEERMLALQEHEYNHPQKGQYVQ